MEVKRSLMGNIMAKTEIRCFFNVINNKIIQTTNFFLKFASFTLYLKKQQPNNHRHADTKTAESFQDFLFNGSCLDNNAGYYSVVDA